MAENMPENINKCRPCLDTIGSQCHRAVLLEDYVSDNPSVQIILMIDLNSFCLINKVKYYIQMA